MATQSSLYFTDGSTRTYPSTKPIATQQHVAVYLKSVADSTWSIVNVSEYELINQSIVFATAPDTALYSEIEVRVADAPDELEDSPSDIAVVAGISANITTVADNVIPITSVATNIAAVQIVSANTANVTAVATNIADINTVESNIVDVNTVATNIVDINSVATTVVPNIAEILLADDNATTATTQAVLASTSATDAQLRAWEAEAERMTADSYATEAEDVFVKVYTSDGDGTFTTTDTTEYSALHWRNKAVIAASGDAENINYDNTTSGLTATDVQNAIDEIDTRSDTHIPLSGITSYHLLSGSLALANSVITSGFATTLYTGNGATQSINTGVDMATQWGNDASEQFGGLVWLKGRSGAINHVLEDTIRGSGKRVFSNLTASEDTGDTVVFGTSGFTLDNFGSTNANLATYASWVFQTTHRKSGVTNHGKAYTCHYNPFTGFTIVKYEGSGIAGHEIPHHLGRKLGFGAIKNLTTVINWVNAIQGGYLNFNTTAQLASNALYNFLDNQSDNSITTLCTDANINSSGNTFILYGWANSYFDEANTLIGNYEVGIYQGTGASGNKVTTRGKPAWVMVKRLDSAGSWNIYDNVRDTISPNSTVLWANAASAESASGGEIIFNADSFTVNSAVSGETNTSGGQYLYMVVYDNDSGSGKSKYPRATDTSTLNLNAIVPFANGVDANGTKNSILVKNETVSGLTLTEGKNYIYSKNDGTYGVSSIAPAYGNVNPASGDFFNVLENKWYTSAGIAITESRNYLDAIVYADQNGHPTYVEQLPKTTYFDEVKANEFKGKNACTAWVNFDGTTTPPTIRDSYNVKAVIRVATGVFDIYFDKPMDNSSYSVCGNFGGISSAEHGALGYFNKQLNKVTITTANNSDTAYVNKASNSIHIFGGKQ